ncbi:MAG: alpha-hydroxy-acid oxidizing enzyme [Acidobacteria bacterium]|nr:MAG: alpha-hydroxy-acid oxidizing enzyme [Acidobacteriota bacterium]
MSTRFGPAGSRRAFLRFLAGSPLAAAAAEQGDSVIASPGDALNVFDFEAAARQKLPPAHFGYIATGVDDDATLRANREGFARIDTSIRLLGAASSSPIVLDPAGSQRAFHPDGEVAVARAARSKPHLLILSTASNSSVEEVNAARGEPVWFQLYAASDWNVSRAMVKRAEAAGCPVLVLTVDQIAATNRETLRRFERQDKRQCSLCHNRSTLQSSVQRKPMFDGLDLKGVRLQPTNVTWDYVRRLKDTTAMKLVIKGILTREDAELAVKHGADAVICSNHGGRADETGRSTIESLPEVLEGAAGRIPVLVDGGFRRGTDVFKALALGAAAVGVARPYLWGLGAFGSDGVEAVLEILSRELQLAMRYAGTPAIGQITRAHVVDRAR